MSDEKRLINMLLSKYNRVGKQGRPVINISETVTVYFGVGLIQLDLDEKNKVLTMSMWTRFVSTVLDIFSLEVLLCMCIRSFVTYFRC